MTTAAIGSAQGEIEFGLNSFGEIATDPSGRVLSDAETVRLIIEEAELAEPVGVDSFSIGEHYRTEMMDSANQVILAAIAGRTERIRLGTSVTVLSTQDPVRLYAEAATLDAASNGRAQLILGRASSPESFPLFGFDMADYETLFEEKLDLFVKLLRDQPVSWSGTVRSALTEQYVKPAIEPGAIPTWVGVGGSPQSVVRAARYGLPLMLAIIGGRPSRFAPLVDLYRRALGELGHPALPVGEHSLGLLAATDDEARETHWPYWRRTMEKIGRERGFHPPTRSSYDADVRTGALFVGSPQSVAPRIADAIRDLGLSRFDLKYDILHLPADLRARSIELYGREVIPRVRELLAVQPEPGEVIGHV
ncbi:LLM class flavin-dependent oxidoreductase [Promicromonospora sp. NPDC090134]|uniref:LLM class flavin-dependent oxidoreductase n=1 Tax=Promicromonospora sp. NPDC090134 TaxID=3364408 RepID=UPI00382036A8